RVEAGIAGELHTAASPYLPSTIVDLGCGDLLVRACARVEESQQRVARCVYIEAIVLRGTVALSRDQRAIMRQQLDSGGTQALEANVVADLRRGVRIGIEPAHIPPVARERLELGLHLVIAVAFIGERKVDGRVRRPLSPCRGGKYEAEQQGGCIDESDFHRILLRRLVGETRVESRNCALYIRKDRQSIVTAGFETQYHHQATNRVADSFMV